MMSIGNRRCGSYRTLIPQQPSEDSNAHLVARGQASCTRPQVLRWARETNTPPEDFPKEGLNINITGGALIEYCTRNLDRGRKL
ncbi:hypothetical protein C8Q80DRAFT_734790 [Daedaleopsis nitida]|nr:hypothetical protein C8Q80DRAFT_734790 [Daedaleopsis nitida]